MFYAHRTIHSDDDEINADHYRHQRNETVLELLETIGLVKKEEQLLRLHFLICLAELSNYAALFL